MCPAAFILSPHCCLFMHWLNAVLMCMCMWLMCVCVCDDRDYNLYKNMKGTDGMRNHSVVISFLYITIYFGIFNHWAYRGDGGMLWMDWVGGKKPLIQFICYRVSVDRMDLSPIWSNYTWSIPKLKGYYNISQMLIPLFTLVQLEIT